eukprot:gnl/TRDRNA2_/TRDRNA2_177451_c0_seq2.p1 gnl/TRDRNA2_/TRDRNA2_177451_c0~~gnl/TRDRNA2_/TRDRNA2_177451_c0_seq2.p1  ORF type:complete len:350 (+),score=62.20 gnl/TRDRNA2_/TRDRNA2_177451_c0_seq2:109-1158(+)
MYPRGGSLAALAFVVLAVGAEASMKLTDAGSSKGWCYAYLDHGSEYCWLMNYKGHYAKDGEYGYKCTSYNGYNADDWCDSPPKPKPKKAVKYTSSVKSENAANSCNPSKLGKTMADFVKSHHGKKVAYSRRRVGVKTDTQCWDLASAAIDHAQKKGFKINRWGFSGASSYVWSPTVVPVSQALPGDIVQFEGKYTEGNMWCASGGHHTAVVTDCGANALELHTMDQNPRPVHTTLYHPAKGHTSGYVRVYRIKDESGSRLFEDHGERLIDDDADVVDDDVVVTENENVMSHAGAACLAGALVVFMVGGLSLARRRQNIIQAASDTLSNEERGATEMEIALTNEEQEVPE